MTPNVDLIRKVMAKIREHPDLWSQKDWGTADCGTPHCFAGWALVLAGKGHLLEECALWDAEAEAALGLRYDQGSSVSTGLFYSGYTDTVDEYERRVTRATGVTFEEEG